jgi:hypothetical protein
MSQDCLFARSLPEKYWNLKLPHKLPPRKDPLPVTGLPMLGYMEQEVAIPLIAALTAAGNFKPKYPFLTPSRSAILYVAYHLKGEIFSSSSSSFVSNFLFIYLFYLFFYLFYLFFVLQFSFHLFFNVVHFFFHFSRI